MPGSRAAKSLQKLRRQLTVCRSRIEAKRQEERRLVRLGLPREELERKLQSLYEEIWAERQREMELLQEIGRREQGDEDKDEL